MELEIFSLCDFCEDLSGKLVIVGTFDTMFISEFPAKTDTFYVVARIRFNNNEGGKHQVRFIFSDIAGIEIPPPINVDLSIQIPEDSKNMTANLIIRVSQLQINKPGPCSVQLLVDDTKLLSLPFIIRVK